MNPALTGSFAVRAALTAGVLALLAARIDLRATADALLRLAPGPAVLVVGLVALDRATMIWRWVILLRATGTAVPARSAASIYLVSAFIGGFLPAGVGADAARAYSLSRRTAQGSRAVASVAVDRLLGLLSLVLMGGIGMLASRGSLSGSLRPWLLAIVLMTALGGIVLFWADEWMRLAVPRRWHDSRHGARALRLADSVAAYRGHGTALLVVALLSVAVQLLRILQAYLLGIGIGVDVPFSYYLLFMPIGLIALMLPISIAGFGLPQGLIVWLLQPRGVAAADALALSTLIVLSGILANLPGAWLYLRVRRARELHG